MNQMQFRGLFRKTNPMGQESNAILWQKRRIKCNIMGNSHRNREVTWAKGRTKLNLVPNRREEHFFNQILPKVNIKQLNKIPKLPGNSKTSKSSTHS